MADCRHAAVDESLHACESALVGDQAFIFRLRTEEDGGVGGSRGLDRELFDVQRTYLIRPSHFCPACRSWRAPCVSIGPYFSTHNPSSQTLGTQHVCLPTPFGTCRPVRRWGLLHFTDARCPPSAAGTRETLCATRLHVITAKREHQPKSL
jgi:hypothetical protein